MLLWPILIGMAALLRMPRGQIGALAMAAAVSIGVYFVGYVFVGPGRGMVILTHPIYAAGFTAILLGAPASYIGNLFGVAVGLGGIALTVLAGLAMLRRRKTPDVVWVVVVGFSVFMIASAAVAAYGRINPADPTFLKAKAVRYAMIALTFWADVVVLIGWLLARLPRRRLLAWHLATAAMTAVLLVAVMGRQSASERAGAMRQAKAADGALVLETGVQDRGALAEVYQDPTVVWTRTAVLRRRRLSVFSAGRQDWLGRQVGDLFQVGPAHLCSGSMGSMTVEDNGLRATGRASHARTNRDAGDILLVNQNGTIVGLGARHAGPDWVGYAHSGRSADTLQAYAVVGGGNVACPLGSPLAAPARVPAGLTPLWTPGDPLPASVNAGIEARAHWIEVTPLNTDPQLLFHFGPELGKYRTVIVRARFEKADGINAFYGKQVQGRGIAGVAPMVGEWLDVYLNISHSPFWDQEHGEVLRFDPVSSAGPGTTALIAGVWGSIEAAPKEWPDIQFFPVPAGEIPGR
jgi:hypothetical protein